MWTMSKGTMVMCFGAVLVATLGVAVADEKKEDEAKEHAEAKKVLAVAKTDLLSAVKTALQKYPDGKAFRAETEEEDGKAIFEVHVLSGGKIKEVHVDVVTGKILKAGDDEDEDADEAKEAKTALDKTKITLVAAIEAALKGKKEAKAFEATIELEEAKAEVEVEFLEGGKVFESKIDPTTGMVLKTKEETE